MTIILQGQGKCQWLEEIFCYILRFVEVLGGWIFTRMIAVIVKWLRGNALRAKWLKGNGLRPRGWCAASNYIAARVFIQRRSRKIHILRRFQILCAAPTPRAKPVPPASPCRRHYPSATFNTTSFIPLKFQPSIPLQTEILLHTRRTQKACHQGRLFCVRLYRFPQARPPHFLPFFASSKSRFT